MGYEYIFKLSDSYDPKENPKDNSLKTSLRDYNYEGDNNAPPGNKGLDFNITVNNTYAETLNENNELDKLHRIRSTSEIITLIKIIKIFIVLNTEHIN